SARDKQVSMRRKTGAEDREAGNMQLTRRAGERERCKQKVELLLDGQTPQVSQPRLPAIQPDVDIRQIKPVGQLARRTANFHQTPQARHCHNSEEHIIDWKNSRGAPDVKPRKAGAEIASSDFDSS